MLNNKIIQKLQSSWSLLIVFVKKSDGSIQFCTNYRKFNTIQKKVYFLPNVDNILAKMKEIKYYTSIDLIVEY
jgi:hypothetical protein